MQVIIHHREPADGHGENLRKFCQALLDPFFAFVRPFGAGTRVGHSVRCEAERPERPIAVAGDDAVTQVTQVTQHPCCVLYETGVVRAEALGQRGGRTQFSQVRSLQPDGYGLRRVIAGGPRPIGIQWGFRARLFRRHT